MIETYSQNKITMQLPYCKNAKKCYLRCTMSLAYDDYVTEQLWLGFHVLSKSAVYWCIKNIIHTCRKVPFKQCLCDMCLNNSYSSYCFAGGQWCERHFQKDHTKCLWTVIVHKNSNKSALLYIYQLILKEDWMFLRIWQKLIVIENAFSKIVNCVERQNCMRKLPVKIKKPSIGKSP